MVRVFAARLPNGWEVLQRVDDRVIHQRYVSDWHRVERNISQFARNRFAYRDAMFHPVPRVDRWDPLIAAAVAAVLAVALVAAAFLH